MYMLDTDICSYIIRKRPPSVLEKFTELDAGELCISVITQAELLYGVERSNSTSINLPIIEAFTSRLIVLDFDVPAAKEYAHIRSQMEATGRIIGNMDMMIAAHALSIDATVITNNTRHFTMVPLLKIENWVNTL